MKFAPRQQQPPNTNPKEGDRAPAASIPFLTAIPQAIKGDPDAVTVYLSSTGKLHKSQSCAGHLTRQAYLGQLHARFSELANVVSMCEQHRTNHAAIHIE